MIPKTTTPLTKFIRTLEGWLIVGSNILLVVLGAVQDMPWTKVGIAASILNAVTVTARSILKAVAATKPIVGNPITPEGFTTPAQPAEKPAAKKSKP